MKSAMTKEEFDAQCADMGRRAGLSICESIHVSPSSPLGTKIVAAVENLCRTMPPGHADFDISVRHEPVCASIRGDGDCDCEKWVTLAPAGLEQKVTVH